MRVVIGWSYKYGPLPYGWEAVLVRVDGTVLDTVWVRYDVGMLPDLARERWGEGPIELRDGAEEFIDEAA